MKLTVLTENAAGGDLGAEHGLSYFIETRSGTALFDTGHSDIFLKNAATLGVDLGQTGIVMLSHGHWDHGNGLKYLRGKQLICHPGAFMKRYYRNRSRNIGLDLQESELRRRFDVVTCQGPYIINEEIVFLGEIPRKNDFEAQTTTFVDENGKDDFVVDDSALAIVEDGKLTVISGCSHAGICNIVEHARNVTGVRHVEAVFGGFHLKGDDRQTEETIDFFRSEGIDRIYPSHCTEMPALAAFYRVFQNRQVKTGMVFEV